jgi:hypothetical protein
MKKDAAERKPPDYLYVAPEGSDGACNLREARALIDVA